MATETFTFEQFKASLPALGVSKTVPLRITLHWTASATRPTGNDLVHYHWLLDGEGGIHPGKPMRLNCPRRQPGYAAHTNQANTNNIGVALCGMFDASEEKCKAGEFGKHAFTGAAWGMAARLVACLCAKYGIPVKAERVLGHSEWRTLLGVKQAGKWDVTCIPHLGLKAGMPTTNGHALAMDTFRTQVLKELAALNT